MTCSPDDAADSAVIDVAVVVVTYNSAEHVPTLASSLATGMGDLRWRVVAVDNASSDDTCALLADAGIEVVGTGRNAGYAAAFNVGLRRFPTARAILLLNPDVVLWPGSIQHLAAVLDSEPDVGVAVPQVRNPGGSLALTQRRMPTIATAVGETFLGGKLASHVRLAEAVIDEQRYLSPTDVEWAVGAVMLISRRCLEVVGEWDESFFLYSEETEYCERSRLAGLRVRYCPGAVVMHEGGGGVRNPRLRSMMVVNRVRLYGRRHSTAATWVFFVAVAVHEQLRALLGNTAARAAVSALLHPARRPPEIQCSDSYLPR